MAASFLPFFRWTVRNGSPFRLPWYHPSLVQLTCTQSLQGRHGYSSSSSSSKEGKNLDKASAGRATVAEEKAADSTRALREAVDALLSLGCTQQDVQRIADKKKSLLVRGYKHILPKAAFFQSHGVNSHDFLKALENGSNLLFAPDEKQESVIEFLRNTVKLTNLGKVIGSMPGILKRRVETLEAMAHLWKELGIPVTGAVLESYPQIFSYSPETIKKGVEAVRSTFPYVKKDVLILFPSIVSRKGHHFKDVVAGLEGIFGPDKAQKVLQSYPHILLVPRETMDNTYKQLKQHFGDLPALKMVKVQPSLFNISWETIKSKIDFLLIETARSKEEICMYPTVLQLSLEKRLKLRHRALLEAGIDHKKFSLWALFSCTNAAFMEKFKVRLIPQQV